VSAHGKKAVCREKFSTDKYARSRYARDASASARAMACVRNYKCAGTIVRIAGNTQCIWVLDVSEILADAAFSWLTNVVARQLHASCAYALRHAVTDTIAP
jgi:hypothetical protein